MTEKRSSLIPPAELHSLVDSINAGHQPDLSKIATISPYVEALYDALSTVKPQTEQLQTFLTSLQRYRTPEPKPRVHRGLLPIEESVEIAFRNTPLARATRRKN